MCFVNILVRLTEILFSTKSSYLVLNILEKNRRRNFNSVSKFSLRFTTKNQSFLNITLKINPRLAGFSICRGDIIYLFKILARKTLNAVPIHIVSDKDCNSFHMLSSRLAHG